MEASSQRTNPWGLTLRPTIALACILKNEAQNLPRLLASVKGCFDEIHLTDTGSTDGSLELIQAYQEVPTENPAATPTYLHHFKWISDFAAARNYAFSKPQTDYIMWLDLDDVLSDANAFQAWRDNVMALGDFWLATYHYSLSPEGKSQCAFARERVVRRDLGFTWRYPVHEGMLPQSPKKRDVVVQYAKQWAVNHLRSAEDLLADRSRNLEIMRKVKDADSRMRYYYGKELFENGKTLEGFNELIHAISLPDLEPHDRIMGIQYACFAAMKLNEFEKAIQLAFQGIQLAPNRAEFFVICGDSYIKLNRPIDALPMYKAASSCQSPMDNGMAGPIFQTTEAYGQYPFNQLARIYINMGDIVRAKDYAERALKLGETVETLGINREIDQIATKVGSFSGNHPRQEVSDIVLTCPPGGLYEWDGEVYRNKGIGGSETAAVEVMEWLTKLTGRRCLVFHRREKRKFHNGVEYLPCQDIAEYMRDFKPALHVAWRHVTKLSEDPYYVWCHDLAAPAIDAKDSKHRVLALSPFHARYLEHMIGVDPARISLTRNGIRPERFTGSLPPKVPGKVIYSSSPDRGLARALLVMDEVVKAVPEAKLHVYYGFDNMYKMGMGAQADDLKRMMHQRHYVVFHGNLPQDKLTEEFQSACVWLYPTNFLETFCITAIEAICSGVYPVVRKWGALADTLRGAAAKGMATVLDSDCVTQDEINLYAAHVHAALTEEHWKRVRVNPQEFSWENVAREWIDMLLPKESQCPSPVTATNSLIQP